LEPIKFLSLLLLFRAVAVSSSFGFVLLLIMMEML
jgi:hypothetical protein